MTSQEFYDKMMENKEKQEKRADKMEKFTIKLSIMRQINEHFDQLNKK